MQKAGGLCIRPAEVLLDDRRAADHDFADLVCICFAAVIAQNAQIHMHDGFARRTNFCHRVLSVQQRQGRAGLSQSIALNERHTTLRIGLQQSERRCRAADKCAFYRTHIDPIEVRMLGEHFKHRRHASQVRHCESLFGERPKGLDHLCGSETIQRHLNAAREEDGMGETIQSADVEQRQERHVYRAGRQAQRHAIADRLSTNLSMVEQNTFGSARRPRRIHQGPAVVGHNRLLGNHDIALGAELLQV